MSQEKVSIMIPTPLKAVVQLGTDKEAIKKLKEEYAKITVTDNKSFAILTKAIATFRDLRGTVIDKHAEAKKPILEEGRAIDAEKNTLIDLIEDAEKPLKEKKAAWDEKEKLRKAEVARIEAARIKKIQDRIAGIVKYTENLQIKTVLQLTDDLNFFVTNIQNDDFQYEEFADHATKTKTITCDAIKAALKTRQAFEDEQKAFAAAKAELAEKEAELNKKQAEIDAAKVIEVKLPTPIRNVEVTTIFEGEPEKKTLEVKEVYFGEKMTVPPKEYLETPRVTTSAGVGAIVFSPGVIATGNLSIKPRTSLENHAQELFDILEQLVSQVNARCQGKIEGSTRLAETMENAHNLINKIKGV